MILLTRSNGIFSSPRIEKYIDYFELNDIDYLVVGWDRLNTKRIRKKTIFYKKKSGYNIGGFRAAINRFNWMFYLIKIFLQNKQQIKTIHAFDLDTAFPAAVFKVLFSKKTQVIFDVCDWLSATLYNQNRFILYSFRKMEAFTIKYSNEVIICEPERIEQIPYKLNSKEIVVPNIPSFTNTSFLYCDEKYKFNDDKIVISYVGGFNKYRMLDELLNVAEKGLINLLIAGYGSQEIEKRCESMSSLSNVKYFGKVKYEKGLNIMYNSDIIYAFYSKSNPNHFYAAPNKYYETMMLGKPIISTKGINMTSKIVNNGIGYVIDEAESDLINLINKLDRADMIKKGDLAQKLWNKKYKTYTYNFLNNKYLELLKQ